MFTLFFAFIVTQRLMELVVARKNEKWMRLEGAVEYGKSHYPYIVALHVAFLLSFLLEVSILDKTVSSFWPVLLLFFLLTQGLRIWAIYSLGKYWNTKVLIVPNANIIQKGPYRYLRHPNYFIVALEIVLIPLLFQAYVTLILFTILNAWMLSVRIPLEEKALADVTNDYSNYMEERNRFSPSFQKELE